MRAVATPDIGIPVSAPGRSRPVGGGRSTGRTGTPAAGTPVVVGDAPVRTSTVSPPRAADDGPVPDDSPTEHLDQAPDTDERGDTR